MSRRLFTPGPTHVREEILAEMARQPIGHRGAEMRALMAEILPGLRRLFGAGDGPGYSVFPATSSGTGLMEAAVATAVRPGERVLNLVCGGFSERWHAITRALGREGVPLRFEWGRGIPAEAVEEELRRGDYAALTLVHNETSTGVLNPPEEIAAAAARRGALLLVDTVSSLGGVPVEVRRDGIDVCVSASQKCLALPPGLALGAVSARALERARDNPRRGFYFDLTKYVSAAEKGEAPFTPATSHYFALRRQLEAIERETLEARCARHIAMRDHVHAWVGTMGGRLSLFAEDGYRSPTVTVVEVCGDHSVAALLREVSERGFVLGGGYGTLQDRTFRIGHMGDHTVEDVKALTEAITDCLGKSCAPSRR
ncbi:MAG: alanine--glyoxylate aminotransferase family protein [Candidatus Tectomicrobia bacterium]|nr:alanine--glyoxylate aminotransferase family protein [Candidatus Tectomicrobia bacterium]